MENQTNQIETIEIEPTEIPGVSEELFLKTQENISFKRPEWVFQFDDNEPVVFAWSNDEEEPGEVNISLKGDSSSTLTFIDRDGKKTFKIFAREITEPTLKMIEQNGENVVGTE
jgi:hypothetical protein